MTSEAGKGWLCVSRPVGCERIARRRGPEARLKREAKGVAVRRIRIRARVPSRVWSERLRWSTHRGGRLRDVGASFKVDPPRRSIPSVTVSTGVVQRTDAAPRVKRSSAARDLLFGATLSARRGLIPYSRPLKVTIRPVCVAKSARPFQNFKKSWFQVWVYTVGRPHSLSSSTHSSGDFERTTVPEVLAQHDASCRLTCADIHIINHERASQDLERCPVQYP